MTDTYPISRAARWALLVLFTLLAAFLRFYNLGAPSLWDGEIFTLLFAQYDWAQLVPSVSAFSAHPPLWFALSKAAITFGWNETILRVPAVCAGILSVPALYVMGKRFFDTRVGLVGAFLLALSPLDVLFSQNARNYSFFVLLTILLLYGAYRAVMPAVSDHRGTAPRRGLARWWMLFVAAALAGLYTHYLFILPLAGTVLAVALQYAAAGARQGGGLKQEWGAALVLARPFLVALIAIVALYLPWTPTVGSAFLGRQLQREAGQEGEQDTAITLDDLPRLVKDFSGDARGGLGLMFALAVGGGVWAWWYGRREPHRRAALFWFAVALLLPIVLMVLLAPRRLPSKYLIYVLPAYLLFAANGIAGISQLLAARLSRSGPEAARLVTAGSMLLLGLIAVLTAPNLPYWNGRQTVFTGEGWQVVDEWRAWRQVAASVKARAAPGDFVLFPEEARALTARSVVPYFDEAFYRKLYSAPPNARVWWVSELGDVPAANAAWLERQATFGALTVQELARPAQFREIALPNASFEEGFKGWEKSNALAQWSREEELVAEGTASARVTLKGPNFAALRSSEFPVTPGKLYRVTAYVRAPTIGFYTTSPQLVVNFDQARNRPPRRTRLATLLPSDKPGWVLMVNDGIVPADATRARVELVFRDYAYELGRTSWVDEVRVWLEQ